jgi:hypothetical protein
MEIDPDVATEEYREHVIGPMRGVMPPDVVKVLEEQFRLPMFKVPMLDGDLAGKEALGRVGRELFGDSRIRDVKMISM